jgi:hypothetical protein
MWPKSSCQITTPFVNNRADKKGVFMMSEIELLQDSLSDTVESKF